MLIYATPITWDLLKETDQRILANFVRVCNILVCRIVSINGLKEAHTHLLALVKEIEREYGPKKIFPNLHLCLHLCECSLDYRLLYVFWCFSTERMNGLLGLFHNSHRNIEQELMKIVQYNALLDKLTSHADQDLRLQESLEILKLRDFVRSLSIYDKYTDEDYKAFRLLSTTIEEGAAFGFEAFPGSFLGLLNENVSLPKNVLLLLTEFYCNTYGQNFTALSNIHNALEGSIPVLPQVSRFSRLRIGTEIFGSTLSSRHAKSAKILARFILSDDTTDTYIGQIQFFFKHNIDLKESLKMHYLAFIRWYKPSENRKTRFYFTIDDNVDSCNIKLWKDEFFEMGRDCIIPIHNILCQFVSGNFKVGQRNPKNYTAIIPINRKYHI
ncbi:hypothetical protein GLOIN_2v1775288 [Rhizophagus irregularis DAOM 181602=DAOM 197198]|uniref:Uncharacterized protein n=1 Tax=Rhizophagus irregularis (strain DAOM 197198w) TaxID=1432141 RepID=A0A015K2R5_RHIIW|nr:hypothetical protein RirG_169060 [Rhizophagus irregularis DAOM 197198w]GBC52186.2 hypothetical protein GLOIN_2v1775288 [Rhizophagus irregularis DAOM 181602=DAOM 197198]